MKVFSRLDMKAAKDERKALGIIKKLEENSNKGQFGSYCKGFASDLIYYGILVAENLPLL